MSEKDIISGQGKDTLLQGHEADGMTEFDNEMPFWWLVGFVFAVVFAVGYVVQYHLADGPSSQQEYQAEVAAFNHSKEPPGTVKEVVFNPLTDAASLVDSRRESGIGNQGVNTRSENAVGETMSVIEAPTNTPDGFRHNVSSIGDQGSRNWIYPKKPVGKFYHARTVVSSLRRATAISFHCNRRRHSALAGVAQTFDATNGSQASRCCCPDTAETIAQSLVTFASFGRAIWCRNVEWMVAVRICVSGIGGRTSTTECVAQHFIHGLVWIGDNAGDAGDNAAEWIALACAAHFAAARNARWDSCCGGVIDRARPGIRCSVHRPQTCFIARRTNCRSCLSSTLKRHTSC